MDGSRFEQCSPGELADAIGQLAALEAATRRSLLEVVAAFDRTEGWRDDGATSMAAWLVAQLGVSRATANEWVRVAGALEALPTVVGALDEGRVCFDQVAAATRMPTPHDDEAMATLATEHSADRLAALARARRAADATRDREAQRRRSLRWWWEHDEASLRLSGRLPAADGAVVVAAIERLAANNVPDPVTGVYDDYASQC